MRSSFQFIKRRLRGPSSSIFHEFIDDDRPRCPILRRVRRTWHFSEETGTPYWLEYARERGLDVVGKVRSFDDLIATFDHFDGDKLLRFEPHERFIPKAYEGKPYQIFETGGTTGMPTG